MVSAERLKQAMEWKGYSQKDLAEETLLSEATISIYCNGKKPLSFRSACLIGEALHVNHLWLLGEDVSPKEELATIQDPDARRLVDFMHLHPEYKPLLMDCRMVDPEDIEYVRTFIERIKRR